jgi:hypothetical protein
MEEIARIMFRGEARLTVKYKTNCQTQGSDAYFKFQLLFDFDDKLIITLYVGTALFNKVIHSTKLNQLMGNPMTEIIFFLPKDKHFFMFVSANNLKLAHRLASKDGRNVSMDVILMKTKYTRVVANAGSNK